LSFIIPWFSRALRSLSRPSKGGLATAPLLLIYQQVALAYVDDWLMFLKLYCIYINELQTNIIYFLKIAQFHMV
jgi:hypothetical protein